MGDGEENERQTPIARGDEEIKFHLTLKNLLYKTNYSSKESFHRCMAVGPACRNMITLPRLVVCVHYVARCDERPG